MLKSIKAFIHSLKFFRSEGLPLQHVEATHEIKKHKVPFSAEQRCAMQPHDFDCPVIGCTKNPCAQRVPDKISRKKRLNKDERDRIIVQKAKNAQRLRQVEEVSKMLKREKIK